MKRSISLFLLIAAAAVFFAVSPTAAGGDGRETISRFCATHGDLGLTHGACVAFFTNRNVVPHDASVCRDPDLREQLGADSVGHRKGPDAPAVASTLRRQDAELGRLLEGLSARGLLETTTLLLVSDHGMAPVERLVNLSEALDEADVRASGLEWRGWVDSGLSVRPVAATLNDAFWL